MARFVKFPGTAGSYASTDDVNLLDADTAHFEQSIGFFNQNPGGGAPEQTTDGPAPIFGNFHGKQHMQSGSGTRVMNWQDKAQVLTEGVPTTPGTVISASSFVATDSPTIITSTLIEVVWYDAAGSILSSDTGSPVSLTTSFQAVSATFTAPALTAFVTGQFNTTVVGAGSFTERLYWDAQCIREGSDATFIPSLRIVGDLDLRVDLAPVYPVSGEMHTIGAWFSGTTSDYRMTINNGQFPVVGFTHDGASVKFAVSGSPLAAPTGTRTRVKLELDLDAGTGGVPLASFYENEVLLSAVDTNGTPGEGLNPGASPVTVGAPNAGAADLFTGDVYTSEVRDGIDGPIVAIFDADDIII